MLLRMEIAIVGGGIAGLTTALALQRQGISCQVYERAAQLNEVGAGIGLAPNAMFILDQLGLADRLRSLGRPIRELAITGPQLRDYFSSRNPSEISSRHQTVFIHRARLQGCLFEACEAEQVHLGARYEGHRIEDDKVCVRVGGQDKVVDLLLGADGIHSAVRRQVFPDSRLRYSGQTCWRGVAKRALPQELEGKVREAWGYGLRFGFGEIGQEELYWFAVQKAAPGQVDEPEGLNARLQELFSRFHPIVGELIEATSSESIIRSDIHDLARLPRWSQDRVLLLGDAAHATTPNMGQGACQGIEDAWYLSHALAHSSGFEEAFASFEKHRRSKVDYVVNNSWRFGQMAHRGWGRSVMRAIMKVTPESMAQKQMLRLLQVDSFVEQCSTPTN